MNKRLQIPVWLAYVLWLFFVKPNSLWAQYDDFDASVPVVMKAYVKSPATIEQGASVEFEGWLEANGGNVVSVTGTTTTANYTYPTTQATAILAIGKEYTLGALYDGAFVDGFVWQWADFEFSAPEGFSIKIESIQTRFHRLLPNAFAKVVVYRQGMGGSGSGVAHPIPPSVGKAIWQLPVGKYCDGIDAGTLEIRQSSLTGIFTPGALNFIGDSSNVEKVNAAGSGDLRQLRLPGRLVDIVPVTNGFEISFYENGSYGTTKSNGVYPITGSALTKFFLENANPGNGKTLRITQTTGTETQELELFYDSGTQEWERRLKHDGNLQSAKRQTQITASPRVVEITQSTQTGGLGTLAEKLRATYTTIGGNQLVTKIVRDFGGKNYTTEYAYYSDNTIPSSYLQKHWEKEPDGDWTRTEYYSSGIGKYGRLHRIFKPFKNTPSTPESANDPTVGLVTTFDYYSSTDPTLGGLLTSREERVNNYLVTKATYSYAVGVAGGKAIVIKTQRNFYGIGANDYLQSVEKYFPPTLAATYSFFRNKPHSVTEPSGRQLAYLHQRGQWNGTTFINGSGDYTRTIKLNGSVNNLGGNARMVQYWESVMTENQVEPTYLYPGQSIVTVEIRNPAGNVIRSEERVYKSGTTGTTLLLSDFEIVGQTDSTFGGFDQLLTKVTLRGTEYNAAYVNGRLKYEIDLTGTKVEYNFEDFDRLTSSKKFGVNNSYAIQNDVITTYSYDAAGRKLSSTISGGGTEQLTNTTSYDLGGEMTQTTDVNGVMRTRVLETVSPDTHYSLERVRVLNGADIYSDSASTYSEVVTTRYRDKRLKDVTGAGLVPTYYEYTAPIAGQLKTTTYIGSSGSPRYTESIVDMLGRTISSTRPKYGGGTLTVSQFYNPTSGLLEKRITPGVGDWYQFYDQFGRLKREGLDADGFIGLQDSSASDRIVEHDTRFVKDGADWWLQTQSFGYPEPNSSTKVLLNRTRERITGFANQVNSGITNRLIDERFSWAINPNPATLESSLNGRANRTYTVLYPDTFRKETHIDSPDSTQDDVALSVNGLAVSHMTSSGAITTTSYDSLLRVIQVDQQTGNSNTTLGPSTISQQFEYSAGKTRIWKQKEKDSVNNWIVSQENDYYADGNLKWTKSVQGYYTRLAYNTRGQLTHRWGDGVTPERRDYNNYGEVQFLYTYRGGTGWDNSTLPAAFAVGGDKVTWARDESTGLLIQKTDASARTESWGIDPYNRTTSHTNARQIVSTFVLDPKSGETTSITYSDSTPTVSFSYNRLGLTRTVTDVTGTRTLNYRSANDYQLDDEALSAAFYGTDLHLRTRYNASDAIARAEGYTFGVAASVSAIFSNTHLDVTFGFDSASARMSSLQANTRNATKNHAFSFSYLGNTDILRQIDGPQSTVWKRVYEPYRSVLKTISIVRGATTYARYELVRDNLGRISQEIQDGQLFIGYGTANNLTINYNYDTRGQLASAETRANNNSAAAILSDRYSANTYDLAANRSTENRYNTSASTSYRENYTPTGVNQYSSKTVRTLVEVGGVDPVGGTITLNYGSGYGATATKPGSGQYWRAELYRVGSTDLMQTASVQRNGVFYDYAYYLQRTGSESLGWDASGNLTNTTKFSLTFDAEDRLVELKDKGNPNIRKTIAYDYQGRRVEEKDYNSTGVLFKWRRFVWMGWMLIAEVDVNVSTQAKAIQRTFVWGPDRTSSIHGVSGIGGLLLIDKSTTQQWVVGSNARGDVTLLLDALGTDLSVPANNLKAGVEYSAYGEVVRSLGVLAELPFRFQSKWALGQVWGGSWGLDFLDFGRRVYSSNLGRFISRDPVGELAGSNLYHYCGNDPINRMDPLGLQTATPPKTNSEEGNGRVTITYRELRITGLRPGSELSLSDRLRRELSYSISVSSLYDSLVSYGGGSRDIFGNMMRSVTNPFEVGLFQGVKDFVFAPFISGASLGATWADNVGIPLPGGAVSVPALADLMRFEKSTVEALDESIQSRFDDITSGYSSEEGNLYAASAVAGEVLPNVLPFARATKAAGLAEEAVVGAERLAAKRVVPEMVTVSRWGRPGLEAGDWVMKGEVSRSTFVRSFKWDWNSTNVRVPFKDWGTGENFVVPKDSLRWPSRWEKFKAIFGQRIYDP